MKRLAIYGTGGFAREVLDLVRKIDARSEKFEVIGWLDDDESKRGGRLKGLPVLGTVEEAVREHGPFEVAIAIGSPPVRAKLAERLASLSVDSPVLVDPDARIGSDVHVGMGTIVCGAVHITTDIEIGRHVLLNLDVTVGHDSKIEDFATLSPSVNVSGSVSIGRGVDIGTGTAIVAGVHIGRWSIVGAGACVVKDLPPNVTAVGVPAKAIKERDEGWHTA